MTTEAIGYTRLSQTSDTSIDRQTRHIEEYCDEHGLTLLDIHDDGERTSGFDDDREEFQRVKAAVKTGDVDAVVVNSKRRLARDFDQTMQLVIDARQQDVDLHTYEDGKMPLDDPMKAAVELLMAASEHKSKMKEIERAMEATAERVQAGHYQGGVPTGLTFNEEKTHLVPAVEDGWSDVVDVLEARRDGMSYRDIEETTGVPYATAYRICDREAFYRAAAERAGVPFC